MSSMFNRRQWLFGTGALAAQAQTGGAKQIVVSSSNGLRCCARAMELLKRDGDTLGAVVAGVNINERIPRTALSATADCRTRRAWWSWTRA